MEQASFRMDCRFREDMDINGCGRGVGINVDGLVPNAILEGNAILQVSLVYLSKEVHQ